MEPHIELAAAVIVRAIEDAKGRGCTYSGNKYNSRTHKALLKQRAMAFLGGDGTFDHWAACMDREPLSLSRELLSKVNEHKTYKHRVVTAGGKYGRRRAIG